jgi:opacity protein-like surface antigen
MNKLLKLTVLACVGFMTASANAGLYVGASYGSTNASVKIDGTKSDPNKDNNALSAYVGYSINFPLFPTVKVEFEYGHSSFDKEGIYEATADRYMVNGYISIPQPLPIISPYVGFGAGSVDLESKSGGTTSSGSAEAYQAMLGVEINVPLFPIKPAVELKYITSSDIDVDGSKVDYTDTVVTAKIGFAF